MKTTKILVLALASVLAFSLAACGGTPQNSSQTPATLPASIDELPSSESTPSDAVPDNETLQKMFVDPLVPTRVIAEPWASPEELNADDVLITFSIKVITDSTADNYRNSDGDFSFLCEDAEKYAEQYFGMSQELLRQSEFYSNESQTYVVPSGLGSGWDIKVTGGNQTGNRLEIQYDFINGDGIVSEKGILTVQSNSDESYQYLSNALSVVETEPMEQSESNGVSQTVVSDDEMMEQLGFKLASWIGVPASNQYVLDGGIAEMEFQWNKTNVALLRIAVNPTNDISGITDASFEQKSTVDMGGIPVTIEYTIAGPMQANWVKNGYTFNLYMKEGESEMTMEGFQDWVGYYVNDFILEPETVLIG